MATYRITMTFLYYSEHDNKEEALEEFKSEFTDWPGELMGDKTE